MVRVMVRGFLVSLVFALAGGCAVTVHPQPRVLDPVAVYVADYGVHSSLLLPNGDGRYVEYCFGDWGYSAENHCWPQDALGALLVSQESAFGRRFVQPEPGKDEPMPVHPAPHHMDRVFASRQDVNRLLHNLGERYQRGAAKIVVHNPDNDTDYVRDTEHYSALNNCNHLTARSLQTLGCRIEGLTALSHFRVQGEQLFEQASQTASTPATMPSASVRWADQAN
jgi:hypothetical protein